MLQDFPWLSYPVFFAGASTSFFGRNKVGQIARYDAEAEGTTHELKLMGVPICVSEDGESLLALCLQGGRRTLEIWHAGVSAQMGEFPQTGLPGSISAILSLGGSGLLTGS
jgi:hypothetical protein